MGHLVTVQNVLRFLGAPLELDREDYPWDIPLAPFPLTLELLTRRSLARYVVGESPEKWPDSVSNEEREAIETPSFTIGIACQLFPVVESKGHSPTQSGHWRESPPTANFFTVKGYMPSVGTTIVYRSDDQRTLLACLDKVAKADVEVLITGPSGVGKELYAAYTHEHSRRCAAPMVTVNCSNLPSHMLENELFGHARGAYTGAHAAMGGIASAADGGSLFFDEIDTLPPMSQAKLLRFIQTKEYRRLGETNLRRADIRFIAASNANLEELVRAGRFREDLYFRLRVVPIRIKPLAERREDIEPLFDHFAQRYATDYELPRVGLSVPARRCLQAYCWPGNVRELENCIRYLTCLDLGRAVEPDDLLLYAFESDREVFEPPEGTDLGDASDAKADGFDAVPDPAQETMQASKARLVDNFERYYVDRALAAANGNISEAARLSGKHRRAFFELLRKYGFNAEHYRRD